LCVAHLDCRFVKRDGDGKDEDVGLARRAGKRRIGGVGAGAPAAPCIKIPPLKIGLGNYRKYTNRLIEAAAKNLSMLYVMSMVFVCLVIAVDGIVKLRYSHVYNGHAGSLFWNMLSVLGLIIALGFAYWFWRAAKRKEELDGGDKFDSQ
jgi:hypothetical protein